MRDPIHRGSQQIDLEARRSRVGGEIPPAEIPPARGGMREKEGLLEGIDLLKMY
jgi:hypothetical protein